MLSIATLQAVYKSYAETQRFGQTPASLYQPINYLLALGGKSMRPTLLLLAANLFADGVENALPQAYAVELFHNFSLMHDDIMDKSPLRRGQDTVHIRYDENAAILSGDVMLVYAFEYLAQTRADILPLILPLFTRTAVGICEGQRLDMDMAAASSATVGEYVEMIRLKTAILLAASLEIGAIVGGANPAQARILANFGLNLGLSFQIQDDYLDTFGQAAQVGKRIGGDILENKKTFLLLKSLELANSSQYLAIQNLLQTATSNEAAENAKIQAMTAIFQSLNIPELTQNFAENYYKLAIEDLKRLDLSPEKAAYLLDFAQYLLNRQS